MLDIKKDVRLFLKRKEDPVKLKNIVKALGLPNSDRQYLKSILADMVKSGDLVKTGAFYWVPHGKLFSRQVKREKTRSKNQLVGRLSVTRQGYGFVENRGGVDWFIPARSLGRAHQGDRVRAEKISVGRNGRITAEVVAIEALGAKNLVGVFQTRGNRVEFLPFGGQASLDQVMSGFPREAEDGMVGQWHRRGDGSWAFSGFLGNFADPGVDEAIVLAENQIAEKFSREVLEEAERFSVDDSFELGDRVDFRDERVFTIDGETARDFDDALHFRRLGSGFFEVGIHIADVSEFVPEGGAMDRWARQVGNSVYLPHRSIPMLPPVLSTELCSLKPDVPRYTISLVVVLDKQARLQSFDLCKGLIRSRYRLTYKQVFAIGMDRDEGERAAVGDLVEDIDLALSLSSKMIQRRWERGGLALDLSEVEISLGADHLLEGVHLSRQTEANRLIEAFMCLANECVATHMEERGIGIPYRIHEEPASEKLDSFAEFLRPRGYAVAEDIQSRPAAVLNEVIEAIREDPAAEVIQIQLLKALKMAEYSEENRGHFGLGSSHYAHFTSPIRRYADLVVHRRLSLHLAHPEWGPEHFDDSELAFICEHISEKERDAARAEQSFVLLKMLRHMRGEVGNAFEGVITEVKTYGFFVRLSSLYVSGLVHVDQLRDDVYELEPSLAALVGQRGGRRYGIGAQVLVRVIRVDLVARKIDLELESRLPVNFPGARQAAAKGKGGRGGAKKNKDGTRGGRGRSRAERSSGKRKRKH